MTIRNREQAAKVAEATKTNALGMCQAVTRGYYLASSAGDVDHDGDADAVDGWESEPKSARHPGDRNPPRGVPVSFSGGSSKHGHRAESLGGGPIRSTDFSTATQRYSPREVGTAKSIAVLEQAMGVTYLGWSNTIDGHPIPMPPATRLQNFHKGGPQWDLNILDRAIASGRAGIVAHVRDSIDIEMKGLPKDSNNSRIRQCVAHYNQTRILRMGLLNDAIDAGRTGVVKHIRDKIRVLIASLPDN